MLKYIKAGGYNANALKLAESKIEGIGGNSVIIPIGKKAVEHFSKRNAKIFKSFEDISENMTIYKALDIAEMIIELYRKHKSIGILMFFSINSIGGSSATAASSYPSAYKYSVSFRICFSDTS